MIKIFNDKSQQKMRKYNFSLSGVILLTGLIVGGCTGAGGNDQGTEYAPNMYHSVAYEPLIQITDESAGMWVNSSENPAVGEYYSSNPNNPYGMNMREPVANTVRRGDFIPYRIPKDSFELAERILSNPFDSTAAVIKSGKELYLKFCLHCHGIDGQTPGKVGERFAGVVSYTSAAVINKGEGHLFHVITFGKGRMGPHASQLSVKERWEIVRYVQILQQQ